MTEVPTGIHANAKDLWLLANLADRLGPGDEASAINGLLTKLRVLVEAVSITQQRGQLPDDMREWLTLGGITVGDSGIVDFGGDSKDWVCVFDRAKGRPRVQNAEG